MDLDLIWPGGGGQNERDRSGRREVGQRCVPAGEGWDRPLGCQTGATAAFAGCKLLVPSCGVRVRSANGPVQLPSGPFRLMTLSDLTESELWVYLVVSFLKHPLSHVFSCQL